MEAREIRSGNFIIGVVWGDENPQQELLCKFLGYNPWDDFIWVDSNSSTERFEEFKPIPLTEDWLLKFGFEWNKYAQLRREKCPIYFQKNKNKDLICLLHYCPHDKITHIHQLQNLYYARTGEELTLKE